MRKRVFFVGLRDGKTKFEFPEPVVDKEHYVTCEEAIGDLPSLQTEKGEIIYGEEIQDYTMKPANSYQRKMRSNSGKVLNHIGKDKKNDFSRPRREKLQGIARGISRNI